MENMFVVESVGKSGGLVLLWKNGVNVTIKNYSQPHINALMKTEVEGVGVETYMLLW
jgi:hypothetical protein